MLIRKIKHDMERRRYMFLYETIKIVLLKLFQETRLTLYRKLQLRQNFFNKIFDKMIYKYSRIHNRCVLTGRSRSLVSKFRLSRIVLRKLSAIGFIPGINKSSW